MLPGTLRLLTLAVLGLDLNSLTSEAQARSLYPKWDLWKSQYRRFNGGIFDGKVTDRLGISVRPRT